MNFSFFLVLGKHEHLYENRREAMGNRMNRDLFSYFVVLFEHYLLRKLKVTCRFLR